MSAEWFLGHWIEITGALTGLIYLYFSVRRIIWLWPFGIVTSLFYVYVFFDAKFYAGMSLQGYYFVVSIYGWCHWLRGSGDKQTGREYPVARLNKREWMAALMATAGLTTVVAYLLITYTDSPVPWPDAFTTAGSIIATWLLARKIIDNWLFWIVIDIVSVGLYIYKGLFPTVFLFIVYTLMAVVGYYQWNKTRIKS
jgi:nicotinamide mononucleotide transporter